ncbi:MAG: hypothetical protein ACREFX_01285 [Opitutaceae bacterium]
MNASEFELLHIVHVASAMMLVGYVFYGFAADPSKRKHVMSLSGIAALLVLVTGLRMWQAQFGFALAGWIVVKIVCWLGLAALAGIGFRRRSRPGLLALITLALATLAIAMVYTKPF